MNTRALLKQPESGGIRQEWLSLLVGVMTFTLPFLVVVFAGGPSRLDSISETYHLGGISRGWFVGVLIAVASIMLGYGGTRVWRRVASLIGIVASLSALLAAPTTTVAHAAGKQEGCVLANDAIRRASTRSKVIFYSVLKYFLYMAIVLKICYFVNKRLLAHYCFALSRRSAGKEIRLILSPENPRRRVFGIDGGRYGNKAWKNTWCA